MTGRAVKATRRHRKAKARSYRRYLSSQPASAGLQHAYPVPFMGLGFGVSPNAKRLRGVILHVQTGYCVDPARGQVFGRLGEPIGTTTPGDYVRIPGVFGMASTLYAHRLVWECVNGPIPEGYHVDHKNAIKDDNRSRNLQAVTPSRNASLVFERGGRLPGEAMSHSKLDEEKVRRIRSSAFKHFSNPQLARMFGVDSATIRSARYGQSWKHVRPGASRTRRVKRKQ